MQGDTERERKGWQRGRGCVRRVIVGEEDKMVGIESERETGRVEGGYNRRGCG